MTENEREVEAWSEALAGRAQPADSRERQSVEALRQAIAAEGRAEQESADAGALKRLTARLEREGLLPASGSVPGRVRAAPAANRALYALAASVAAVAVLVGTLTMFGGPGEEAFVERERGFAGVARLEAADPAARAQQLRSALEALGVEAQVTVQAGRHIVDARVPPERVEAVAGWARTETGALLEVEQPGRYRLIVEPPGPSTP